MIAIVYPQLYGIGGIARYLDSFLSNLPMDHPPIYVITGESRGEPKVYPGVEIIHLAQGFKRFSLLSWGLNARRVLRSLYTAGKIKVVNLHFPPLISGLFLPNDIPTVLTVHSTYLGMSGKCFADRFYPSDTSWPVLKAKMYLEKRIFGHASKAIALTEFGCQQIRAYGFHKPVTIIPNGVALDQFEAREVKRDIDVLFSGRIEQLKGSRPLVEVCRRLVASKPDISISIVGFGEEEQRVRQQLRNLQPNITFTGKVPFSEMVGYYNRSRVYVSTSYYEGLPGTCLEAMAMRLPAVVWNLPFYHHLVIGGETGELVSPNDYDGMTGQILHLLAHRELAEVMGSKGRALLESEYGWKKLATDVLAVFQEMGRP